MKTIEFNPEGESTEIPAGIVAADEATRREILFAVLPLIFHKLKNKLTPVLGYTQILQSRSGDDFVRERLARIERNTAELADALNTLKDYCRPPRLELNPGELNRVLEDLGPCWQAMAKSAGAKIVLELSEALPAIPLHAGHLRILLLALTENAAAALADRPAGRREIRIATRFATGVLLLSVRDNGRGMSDEEAASAWMPFFSRFSGRAGLGLTLCEKIIVDHNAAGSIASVPGEFCEITVSFPLPPPGAESDNHSHAYKEDS